MSKTASPWNLFNVLYLCNLSSVIFGERQETVGTRFGVKVRFWRKRHTPDIFPELSRSLREGRLDLRTTSPIRTFTDGRQGGTTSWVQGIVEAIKGYTHVPDGARGFTSTRWSSELVVRGFWPHSMTVHLPVQLSPPKAKPSDSFFDQNWANTNFGVTRLSASC